MHFETAANHEEQHNDVEKLLIQITREGVDTTNLEEVLKVAELLFGDDKTEPEVLTIVEALFQKLTDGAAEAV